jgi:hypothetical protein
MNRRNWEGRGEMRTILWELLLERGNGPQGEPIYFLVYSTREGDFFLCPQTILPETLVPKPRPLSTNWGLSLHL